MQVSESTSFSKDMSNELPSTLHNTSHESPLACTHSDKSSVLKTETDSSDNSSVMASSDKKLESDVLTAHKEPIRFNDERDNTQNEHSSPVISPKTESANSETSEIKNHNAILHSEPGFGTFPCDSNTSPSSPLS